MKLAERACDLTGSQIAEKIASVKKIEERNIKKLLAVNDTRTDTNIYSKIKIHTSQVA